MRWRVYMMNLGYPEARHIGRLVPLARYLTREWNESHAEGERLERLWMYVLIADHRAPDAAPGRLLMCEYDAPTDRVIHLMRAPGP
jgi:hypothetical protein